MKQLDLFGFAQEPAEKKEAPENPVSLPEENKKEVVADAQENTLIFSNKIFGVKMKLKEVPEEKVLLPNDDEVFPVDVEAPVVEQALIEEPIIETETFPLDENIIVEEPLIEETIASTFEEEIFPIDEDAPVIEQVFIEEPIIETETFPIDENIIAEEPLIEETIASTFEEEIFPIDEDAPTIEQAFIEESISETETFPLDENIIVEEPLIEETIASTSTDEIFLVDEVTVAIAEDEKTNTITEFSLSLKQKPQKETKTSTKNKRGRKSFKDIDAEIEFVNVPEDEALFEKQYYTISTVAKWFNVNTSLIRYWENEFDILKPRKNRKGDRLFRPEDVKNMQVIYYLLRQRKFSLEGAKSYLKQNKQRADTNIQLIQSLTKFRSFLLELKANLEL